MKLNYTFNTLVWINKSKAKNGIVPIYIRITIDGKRVEISTGKTVAIEKWSTEGQNVKGNNEEARTINQYVRLIIGQIEKIHLNISNQSIVPTVVMIKQQLLSKEENSKPKEKTILEAITYHNLKMKEKVDIGLISKYTLARYTIVKSKISSFIKKRYAVKDLELKTLKLSFITEFEHYLLTNEKQQTNSAHKYIKNIKTVINMAIGLDWMQVNPFTQFKCSYKNPDREILNQPEITAMINKKLNNPRLEKVRDIFIFCCYTGFAYADVKAFERNSVMLGLDGEYWLSTNRQKTGIKESVPLLPKAIEIIEKYKNHAYCVRKNKLLPVSSNQKFNVYLKEIGIHCKINKKLTSHIARHTFATTVTLANGVPIETVSSMLGHTNIRTTQIYAKVVEQKVSDDMKLLRQKLYSNTETIKLTS